MKRDPLTEVSLDAEAQDMSVDSAVALTVNLVRAYVANHIVPPAQLAALLEQTHRTVLNLSNLKREEPEQPIPPVPAGAEHITCLECGKAFRALKRHLSVQHGLTPDAYRMRWGLPSNYPVTAPDYAATRSSIARARGLGKRPQEGSDRAMLGDGDGDED